MGVFHPASASSVLRAAMIVLAIALCTGCASTNTYQSARTLVAGAAEYRVTGGLGGYGLKIPGTPEEGEEPSAPVRYFGPYTGVAEVGVRYGLNGLADVGIALGTSGLTLDTKVQLLRRPVLAIALGLNGGGSLTPQDMNLESDFYAFLGVPLLVGFQISDGVELVLCPRIALTTFGIPGEMEAATLLPSMGIAVRAQQWNGRISFIEVSMGKMTGIQVGGTASSRIPEGLMLDIGVGIVMGGPYSR